MENCEESSSPTPVHVNLDGVRDDGVPCVFGGAHVGDGELQSRHRETTDASELEIKLYY